LIKPHVYFLRQDLDVYEQGKQSGRHRSFKDEFCAQTEKKWSDHNNDEKQLYIYSSVGP
jgi:hypothetical protein